jgi:hypothetical protein
LSLQAVLPHHCSYWSPSSFWCRQRSWRRSGDVEHGYRAMLFSQVAPPVAVGLQGTDEGGAAISGILIGARRAPSLAPRSSASSGSFERATSVRKPLQHEHPGSARRADAPFHASSKLGYSRWWWRRPEVTIPSTQSIMARKARPAGRWFEAVWYARRCDNMSVRTRLRGGGDACAAASNAFFRCVLTRGEHLPTSCMVDSKARRLGQQAARWRCPLPRVPRRGAAHRITRYSAALCARPSMPRTTGTLVGPRAGGVLWPN